MANFITWISAATMGNKLKSEFNNTFNKQPEKEYLPDEYHPANDEPYDKELHQSWGAKRAAAAHSKGLSSVKSSVVREAQERRKAAALAAAKARKK